MSFTKIIATGPNVFVRQRQPEAIINNCQDGVISGYLYLASPQEVCLGPDEVKILGYPNSVTPWLPLSIESWPRELVFAMAMQTDPLVIHCTGDISRSSVPLTDVNQLPDIAYRPWVLPGGDTISGFQIRIPRAGNCRGVIEVCGDVAVICDSADTTTCPAELPDPKMFLPKTPTDMPTPSFSGLLCKGLGAAPAAVPTCAAPTM